MNHTKEIKRIIFVCIFSMMFLSSAPSLAEVKFSNNQQDDMFITMINKMAAEEQRSTLCFAEPINARKILYELDSYFKNQSNNSAPTTKDYFLAIWKLYPCPFSPYTGNARPAASNDLVGVWRVPKTSLKLRMTESIAKRNQKHIYATNKIDCDIYAYYSDGGARHIAASEKELRLVPSEFVSCPISAKEIEWTKKNKEIVSWNLIKPGRMKLTRSDLPEHIEEWDVFVVTKPFDFEGATFSPGDLLQYARILTSEDMDIALAFVHLQKLPD